jgi:hypothetical protein
MNDNVVHLNLPEPRRVPRSRLVALSAAALAAADLERSMCIEAAASMAEMLGDRVSNAHPALITPESVGRCLAMLAARIRDLKGDVPPTEPEAAA